GDDPDEGSRRQYADGCALHRGPDNGHGSKGQAAGGTFPMLVGFWTDRAGTPSLSMRLDALIPTPMLMRLFQASCHLVANDMSQGIVAHVARDSWP
ncbi:hypothetical protein Tco_0855259, partial [Tanacetum coccineum]